MDVVSPEPENLADLNRVGPVQKSTSLQEFHSRNSLSGISESMASPDNFNSSGVYSGSIDISDVCMADLTKLSESTMCSPTGSQGDQALAVSTPSYPMMSLRSAQITADCTPIRNVVELLSPQFGANDEYIHRNIIFIHKQLKSLMLQLATDDKYFQTTVEKYEDIISRLNEEIRNLKNADSGNCQSRGNSEGKDPSQPRSGHKTSEITLDAPRSVESEKNSKERGDELNALMTKLRSDILASFRDTLRTASSSFSDLQEDFPQIDVDSVTPEDIVDSFQKLVTFSGEITSKYVEANSILSEKLSDSGCVVDRLKSDCETSRSEEFQRSVDLKAKLRILLDENSSLRSALNEKNESERQKELELSRALNEISELKTNLRSKDSERERLAHALKELEHEHKKLIEDYRIKGSSLILENSKLKQELEESHTALTGARLSAEKNTEKFDELQKLYAALNEQMSSREAALGEIERQRNNLEIALKGKDSVLERLCSNFNELLAIFRECQNLGLDQDSSATDIDDGFVRLKRRLLDLSQDYITLNNRNKVLEKELVLASSKLKGKEEEMLQTRKKMERKSESLQKTLEKLESENRELVTQKIEREDSIKQLNEKIQRLETRGRGSWFTTCGERLNFELYLWKV
ncbi:unnamed protein product [Nesidiocoris tenuis]|uniref:Uncharacterized protein n=1 Tax=Nesidiocoris tenuis TaxID=355587 RepID=A0A6H5G519_9HEMI|nr:unnamed protein product [Nesidiocoris tenuis]